MVMGLFRLNRSWDIRPIARFHSRAAFGFVFHPLRSLPQRGEWNESFLTLLSRSHRGGNRSRRTAIPRAPLVFSTYEQECEYQILSSTGLS